MSYNSDFGPAAQTPEQRARVLQRMQEVIPRLKTKITPHTQLLYDAYIAGEMSWEKMRQAMDKGPS